MLSLNWKWTTRILLLSSGWGEQINMSSLLGKGSNISKSPLELGVLHFQQKIQTDLYNLNILEEWKQIHCILFLERERSNFKYYFHYNNLTHEDRQYRCACFWWDVDNTDEGAKSSLHPPEKERWKCQTPGVWSYARIYFKDRKD